MITLKHVSIRQGAFSLNDLALEVPRGEYAMIMGPSGSGKTTILEVICGLRSPDYGRVYIAEKEVTNALPAAREVGYVPQDGALFKTMNVHDQLAFALTLRKRPFWEIEKRVTELAELLHIPHLLERGPLDLSGGERQRVALGRALSFWPKVILLDEPLSALDDQSREQIMLMLKEVQDSTGVTTLHVTHNRSEARFLGTMGFCIEQGALIKMDFSKV